MEHLIKVHLIVLVSRFNVLSLYPKLGNVLNIIRDVGLIKDGQNLKWVLL